MTKEEGFQLGLGSIVTVYETNGIHNANDVKTEGYLRPNSNAKVAKKRHIPKGMCHYLQI